MDYPYESGNSKLWIVMLIMLFVLGGILYYYKDKISFIGTATSKVKSYIPSKTANAPVLLPSQDWCKSQELPVKDSQEDPVRDRILGWDTVEQCCVREISGFSCATQGQIIVKYCYTANIGGIVSYVNLNNYYAPVESYRRFIDDTDKAQIVNKFCSTEGYPKELIIPGVT